MQNTFRFDSVFPWIVLIKHKHSDAHMLQKVQEICSFEPEEFQIVLLYES